MYARVESGDVRYVREGFPGDPDPFEVVGIVQGRETNTFLNFRLDVLVDDNGFAEGFSTVDDTVSHRVHVLRAVEGSDFVVLKQVKGGIQGGIVVQDLVDVVILVIAVLKVDLGPGQSDTLNQSLGNGVILVFFDEVQRCLENFKF